MENSIEEDIEILSRIRNDYHECKKNCKEFTSNVTTINREEYEAIEHILSDYKKVLKENEQLRTEVNRLKEEKEQYKNDYFNLYEQNKQYIHYSKIEGLAEKIHNKLDKNGITRAYQTIIDSYFDEVLGG